MIIDSSAVIAVLKGEPEALDFARRMETSQSNKMSAANFVETSIVVDADRKPAGSQAFDAFLERASIEIVPVTVEHARLARQAYRDYGKGSGHPARLNFGDCFAYALAKTSGEALLFKGRDFAHTDVASARA